MATLKTGDRVRLINAQHGRIGTINSVADGMAAVSYEHRPGVVTKGYYPVGHLERVEEVKSEEVKGTEPVRPAVIRNKATAAQILGGAK